MQDAVESANPIAVSGNFERWSDPETSGKGFADVQAEYETFLMGRMVEKVAMPLGSNFKVLAGDRWTEGESGRVPTATVSALRARREEYVAIDEPDCKGVGFVAWVATAKK